MRRRSVTSAIGSALLLGALLAFFQVNPAFASEVAEPAESATCGPESWAPWTGVISASCTGPGAVLFHVQCASPAYDRSSGWMIVPTAGRTMTYLFPVCNGNSRVTVSTRAL